MTHKLMIKTHNVTGLKYLCKTEREGRAYDVYKGSGKAWQRHLKEFGDDISTELLLETDDFEYFKSFARSKSAEWNVVESDEWANLIPETGERGGHYTPHTEEYKKRMSIIHSSISKETRDRMSEGQRKRKHDYKGVQAMAAHNIGKSHSEETKRKQSETMKKKLAVFNPHVGKKRSEETKRKMREAWKLRKLGDKS